MALTRGITRPLACHSCQRWILQSFIASVAGQAPIQTPAVSPRRPFTRTAGRTTIIRQDEGKEEFLPEDISNETSQTSPQPSEPSSPPKLQPSASPLPWYLQVQQPLPQPESPLSDRQKLPDLPLNPPALLQPLLEHVSTELGMDDLSLLDMRTMDPPPALGANLFMIVGTARSEKHLHVSADRLCRWLRTEHRLSPYADGLLGRNELKLKLRRKAKRTRLLSAVGAKEPTQADLDDGIRTGWVCVNIGRVPGGELPLEEVVVQDRTGVVGFGSITGGSSLVVQLMTEEKRGEIDLEKLWTDALRRSDKRKEKLLEDEEQVGTDETTTHAGDELDVGSVNSAEGRQFASQHLSTVTYIPNQLRAFHSSARREAVATATAPAVSLLEQLPETPSLTVLQSHISHLKTMEPKHARGALGVDFLRASIRLGLRPAGPNNETESVPKHTKFVHSFYSSMPSFPGREHYHLHFELLSYARQLGHKDLHSTVFGAHLRDMQVAGFIPEERTFKLALRSILAPLGRSPFPDGVDSFATDGKMLLILSILEDMEACGYNPLTSDILELMHQACLGPPQHSSHTNQLNNMIPALRVAKLRRHVREDDWQSFWTTWHAYPRHFLPRTSDMYAVLFQAISDGKTRNVEEARGAMKVYLSEMDLEEPSVTLNRPLAQALICALTYVEPALLEMDNELPSTVVREWRILYERCRQTLQSTEQETTLESHIVSRP